MTTEEVSPQGDSVVPTPEAPAPEVATDQLAVEQPTPEQPVVKEPVAEQAAAATPPVEEAPPVAATPPVEATPPVAEASAPTPSVAEMMAAPVAAAAVTAAVAPAAEKSGDGAAARIREKLASSGGDKPVGSEDIKSKRPEMPTNVKPVDIPSTDDLDAELEAEILSALGEQAKDVVAAPEIVVDPETGATTKKAPPEPEEIGPGSKVSGTVQHIHGDDIFVNAGLLADVVVSSKQFADDKQPAVG